MKKRYLFFAFLLLVIEILITQTTGFIRHTLGDSLAVIFLYCLIKGLFKIKVNHAAITTLIIAFGIEIIQLTSLSQSLVFQKFPVLKLILGTSFSWSDLLAYTLGIIIVLSIEKYYNHE